MRDAKIVVHGCYHTNNYGDLLILDFIALKLKKMGSFDVVCPWVSKSQIDNVLPRVGKGMSDYATADLAVFGGGGYFVTKKEVRSVLRFFRYFIPALVWRLKSIPYIVLGVGVGPEVSWFIRTPIRILCNGASVVAVRDDDSFRLLENMGVSKQKLLKTADWILDLRYEDIPEDAQLRANQLLAPLEENLRLVGIHFSTPTMTLSEIDELVAVLSQVQSINASIQFVWIFDNSTKYKDQIEALFHKRKIIGLVLPKQNHWTTAAVISKLDAIFTSKLHVGITAWALGVIPMSLSYHGKTKRFYKQIDWEEYQRDYNGNFLPLVDWLKEIDFDKEKNRLKKSQVQETVRKSSGYNVELLASLISNLKHG